VMGPITGRCRRARRERRGRQTPRRDRSENPARANVGPFKDPVGPPLTPRGPTVDPPWPPQLALSYDRWEDFGPSELKKKFHLFCGSTNSCLLGVMLSMTPRLPSGTSEGQVPRDTGVLSVSSPDSCARNTIARVDLSTDNPSEKTRRGGRPRKEAETMTGLHQKFLRHCEVERRLAPQTIVSYRSDFAQFLESLRRHGRFGLAKQDRLATFSEEAIRDYQYDMVAWEWSRATCRRRLIQLNRFGKWLVKRGHVQSNPMDGIEIPKRERSLPKVLPWSVAEHVVVGESRVRNCAILAALVYSGLRRGEVVRLNVGSLQREGDIALRVRGKGNKDRVVGLPRQAVEAFDAYLATRPGAKSDEPLFLKSGGRRITARVISKAVARAGRRLGVHLHPHLFRHTYATRLHELGVDLLVIQGLLGHESVATTEIYTRVSAARQRQAIQALEGGSSREVVISP